MEQIVGMEEQAPTPEEEDRYLQFLLDEGLDLLSRFQRITDGKNRRLVLELVKALATTDKDDEPGAGDVFPAAAKLS